MRAAVTTGSGGFAVVTLPDPSPGPDQLVIRVAACGVCGSDLKARPFLPPGTVMGHEFGGEVVAVGTRAHEWREGTNVAVLPVLSCGGCEPCSTGEVAHCGSRRYVGMGTEAGGFAELVVVPARLAFPLPEELPRIYAALVEPFAVGLHGVRRGEVGPGDRVLVVGAGGVGLTTLAWARVNGAAQITVADPEPARRALAQQLGATDVLASAADADRDTYDVAVECVGRPELMEQCEAAVRALGRIVIAGACDKSMSLEPIGALLKELTIRFSVAYQPDEFHRVIDAFRTGAVDPSPVIGPTVGLDRVGEAFDLVRNAGTQGRVLVAPTP
jgi:(R,R)-butanediol dehydrogenase / meso-butanediol dehydrogenase / diacetyl reductase